MSKKIKISGRSVPSTDRLIVMLREAMGDRYSPALDATIYVAAESLHNYRRMSADLNKLDSLTYKSTSDRGASRILKHPLVDMTSAAQRDTVNALKALGLSLSRLEGGKEIDPIEELEQ